MPDPTQPSAEGEAQSAAAGAGEGTDSPPDGGESSEAGADGSGGEDIAAKLQAATDAIARLEQRNQALTTDIVALKNGKNEATTKAKTAEERLADMEAELKTEREGRAKLAAEKRRDSALDLIVSKVPAANAKTVRRLALALAAENDLDLGAEDRAAPIQQIANLLQQDHASLLKEPEPTDPFPQFPRASNAAPGETGAATMVKGIDGKSRQVM